jgi:hypothetical protein
VLRRIFGPKREEVAGDWRRLHNEELHNLYASQNFIKVMKARSITWAEHVAHTGEINAYKILVQKLKGRDHLEDLGIGGKIILEWILGKVWSEFVWWALINTVMKLRFPLRARNY